MIWAAAALEAREVWRRWCWALRLGWVWGLEVVMLGRLGRDVPIWVRDSREEPAVMLARGPVWLVRYSFMADWKKAGLRKFSPVGMPGLTARLGGGLGGERCVG